MNNLPFCKFILLFITFIGLALTVNAQHLFSVHQNNLSQENIIQIETQIAHYQIPTLFLTRNHENKNIYPVSLSSVETTKLIILNEQTGNHIVVTPVEQSLTEFQLTPFFIEEMKQATLGNATRYLVVEVTPDFAVRNVASVSVSHDEVYIPRYLYGNKEDVKEALPQDRQIINIYKAKPHFISAFPDNPEHERYISQLEEEMSYYVYMFKLPDGTLCTYDEHFNLDYSKESLAVGNFLTFNLTGALTETQRTATEYALELWSEQLAGPVPVDIFAGLYPLGTGVLGMSMWPPSFVDNGVMYPSGLWSQMKGYNAAPGENDIFIIMNSDYSFYFGLDGNPGRPDFVTIMLHEVTHGLGFFSLCSSNGHFDNGYPGIFDCMLYEGLNGPCITELSDYEREELIVSNNLYAGRPGSNLLAANNGIRVPIYSPIRYSGGSSGHHWASNVGFPTFMKYAYDSPLHTFNDRKIGVLVDMGWTTPDIDPNAVWITFDGNTGTGSITPQPFSQGEAQDLKRNVFTKTGYRFTNWNNAPDGSGISYQDRQSITIYNNLELFAQWEPQIYTLTFKPNSGTVNITSKEVTYLSPIGELPIPEREGYQFEYWSMGIGRIINEEMIWKYTSDMNTMAIWTKIQGVEENQNLTTLQIFPNPTTGELRITNYELRINDIEVFDVYGRKLMSNIRYLTSEIEQSEIEINISDLAAGIYLIKITTDTGNIVKKIIKQ